jgi:hypothetical protein
MTSDRLRVATLLVGPAAWTVEMLGGYLLAPRAGTLQTNWRLHVLAAVCAAAALVATVAAFRQWNGVTPPAEGQDAPLVGRAFVSLSAAVLNGFFVLVILAEAIPPLFIRPGD